MRYFTVMFNNSQTARASFIFRATADAVDLSSALGISNKKHGRYFEYEMNYVTRKYRIENIEQPFYFDILGHITIKLRHMDTTLEIKLSAVILIQKLTIELILGNR